MKSNHFKALKVFATIYLLLSTSSSVSSQAAKIFFDPRQFGAKADGATLDTLAIQKAIDAAARVKGVVTLVGGQFLSGTLIMKSDVTLQIAKNASLLGSTDYADYQKNRWLALIEARGQQKMAITGEGVIDGRGTALAENVLQLVKEKKINDPLTNNRPDETNRPQLIEIVDCSNVAVRGITLKDSACWVEAYVRCDKLEIDHVTVRSTSYWNNDGVDLIDCTHAKITHCDIDSADDAICLKSDDANRGCEDITIEDCNLRSSASALKFGTSSHGGFKRIKVQGLRIHDTFRSTVAIECVDGGVIEDVNISDVQATNTGNAFFIRLGHRNQDGEPGSIRNVRITDMTVEIPATAPDAGYSHPGPTVRGQHNLFPSSIVGLPGHNISDVSMKNITIITAGGGRREVAEVPLDKLSSIPEKERDYPEFSMFGELPSWGFYVRHAEGISFENVSLRTSQNDYRSAMVFDDVKTLLLKDVGIGSSGENPIIVLSAVKDSHLEKMKPPEHVGEFVRQMNE